MSDILGRAGCERRRSSIVKRVGYANVVVIASVFCWIYVAAVAAFAPARLASHVAEFIPVRWDTFGIASFLVAGSTHLAAGLVRHRDRALANTTFLCSTLVVLYLATNLITHPHTMKKPLTHVAPWPSEAQTLILACLLSCLAFIALQKRSDRAATE
jgi:hypothetical protein